MIPARCLNTCLFNARGFHITCGILVKSLCWFGCQGDPVCVCGMGTKGHKCHLVSPFSYVSISHLFEFRWRVLSYEFTSVYKNFLIFLKVCGPALSKGISFAFLVHGNICCGAVCDVYSELPYYMCDSSDLQNALVRLGGRVDIFLLNLLQ